MKSHINLKACLSCKTCCQFYPGEEAYAPVFSACEMKKIPENKKRGLNFHRKGSDGNVFQIDLVPSKREKKTLVCPFYDEKTHLCSIYEFRPLDCKLWPYMISRSKSDSILNVSCVRPKYCPAVASVGQGETDKYHSFMMKKIRTDKLRRFFRKYPAYAWKNEPEYIRVGTIDLSE